MELTGIRKKVFLDRYALKDAEGNLVEHTPEEMWKRVAKGIAKEESKEVRKEWEKKFYSVMKDFKFVPGGRILSGAGTNFQVTYFNCFVIPSPKDSRGGILESLGQLVEIQARAGGVGLNLSSLRPRGARVKKVNGTSSGPINWAGLFSTATHDIVQQGGSRRGATMLMMWDWHPDVEEFITVKQDLTKINGANLSVCVSDAFMEAVKQDKDWQLMYPDLDDPHYDNEWDGDIWGWKEKGYGVKVYKTVKAKELWDLICTAAWQSAEPGLHFMDRSNKRSNTHYFEKLISTNPCGEQPLGAWAVCNLGAMNLSAYVKGDDLANDKPGKFDFEEFAQDVKVAMRFMDNVIDNTYYFFPENDKCAHDIRRTGLGIMGIADALIKMHLKYGSDEAAPVVDKIFKVLRDNAYEASSDIAAEKGSFPMFDRDKYLEGYHIQNLPKRLQDKIAKQGIRNAVLLTIAPTGTTSLVAGVSSGVEPVYEFTYKRTWRGGEDMIYHPLYEQWLNTHPDEERPSYFVGANDLTPLDHTKVQAIAQKYIDSSISKTVNAPNSHTVKDVQDLYMAAYDMGLKGITYMRDGSRQGVLERVDEKPKVQEEEKPTVASPMTFETPVALRPTRLNGTTYVTQSPIGKAYITINHTESGDPFEVFITLGKPGSDTAAMADALGRMISLTLRINAQLEPRERIRIIIEKLTGIGGARSVGFGKNRVRSLPDAVAKVLADHYNFTVNGQVVDRQPAMQPVAAEVAVSETTATVSVSVNGHANGNGLSNGMSKPIMADAAPQAQQLTLSAAPQLEEHDALTSSTNLFDLCPDCGATSLAYEEGCKKCYSCGYSEC